MSNYKQGDIVKVCLDPTSGHEQKGYRPVLIIQNNLLSKALQSTTVVLPISNSKTSMPFEVNLDSKLKTTGKVLCRHIRAIDLSNRKCKYVETVSDDLLDKCLNYVSMIISK